MTHQTPWRKMGFENALARRELNQTMVAGPVFANGTLYLLTEHRLFAVGGRK